MRRWGPGAPFLLKAYPNTDGVRHYGGASGRWLPRAQFCSSGQSLDTCRGLGSPIWGKGDVGSVPCRSGWEDAVPGLAGGAHTCEKGPVCLGAPLS